MRDNVITGWLVAALLSTACAIPAMAESSTLPAITDPVTQEHHTGKVIFTELVTPNLTGAEKFYGRLFGWKFQSIQSDSLEYAEATLNGRPVAGLIHKDIASGEHKQPAWLTFISARNIGNETDLAERQGAKLLFGPVNIPDRGREAVLADPQGAVFALLDSSSGDPVDDLSEPGEWIWSSLMTSDPDAAADFYQGLFNYDIYDLPSDQYAQHFLMASDGYSRASVNTLASNPHSHSHWLNYVRVNDTAKMTKKVVALGGNIVVAPHLDRHGGKVAVVTDPQGAPFGLIEWSVLDTKEIQ